MTASFHKFGEYFPGTGDYRVRTSEVRQRLLLASTRVSPQDIGHSGGLNTSINFPLRDGMDDEAYRTIFRPVIGRIMERFRPGAIVLQCGADSLSGDRLGCFNLSLKGHGDCVSYVKVGGISSVRRDLMSCDCPRPSIAVLRGPDPRPRRRRLHYAECGPLLDVRDISFDGH